MTKQLFALASIALALSACNSPNHMEGTLAVKSTIKVNTTSGKQVAVAPANYKTSLALDNDSAEVRIHTQSGRVIFSVPGVKADGLGNINMSAAKIGQEFALQGKLFSETYGIDRIRAGSCVHHYDQEYKCRDERHCVKDAAGNETCGTENVCGYEQVPVYGTEDIHEVGSQDTKNAAINLVKGGKTAGVFNASYTYRENISRSEVVSGCRM